MNVLTFAISHGIDIKSEGRTSYRATCPRCAKVGGMVISRDKRNPDKAWRYWLNCCGDSRGGDVADLRQILQGRSHFSPKVITDVVSDEKLERKFDAAFWRRNLYGTQLNLKEDSPGGQYLLSRGLLPATWERYQVGEGHRAGEAALLLPWFNQGHLVGGRFRLLNAPDKKQRYAWWTGSECYSKLYGSHAMGGNSHTLIVCEGELNSMSIWQATGGSVDVLSTGTENAPIPDSPWWANRWANVFCYFDKCDKAKAWAKALHGKAICPEVDANELLQAGELADLLKFAGVILA